MRVRRTQAGRSREDGIALLVVIWVIGLLALQVVLFTGSVRDAVRLAENEMAAARGEALVLAAVEYTAARLLSALPEERWRPSGQEQSFDYAGAKLRIRMTDERARINLNHADEALLNGLFRVATGSSSEAGKLTARFLKWRGADGRGRARGASAPPSGPAPAAGAAPRGADGRAPTVTLLDTADIGRVLDLPATVLAALLPMVTIYGGDSRINPMQASEAALRALPDVTAARLAEAILIRSGGNDPITMEAALASARERLVFTTGTVLRLEIDIDGGDGVGPGGGRRGPPALGGAVVIISTGIDAGAPYRILAWRPRNDNNARQDDRGDSAGDANRGPRGTSR